jgi:hypothetical protein
MADTSTINLTGQQVINFAAARLNDASQQIYTNAVCLPFLNIALNDLQEIYQVNNIPVTDETSAVINVDSSAAGILVIPFDVTGATGVPDFLPDDLLEVKVLWESPRGQNNWTQMTRLDYLPEYQLGAQINQFVWYQWATNTIKVIAANANNDLKMDYVRRLFTEITDVTDDLLVQTSLTFLGNRVASYVASDIEENQERADRLWANSLTGLDNALTIPTKGRQRITTRRRPFRAGYKAFRSGGY